MTPPPSFARESSADDFHKAGACSRRALRPGFALAAAVLLAACASHTPPATQPSPDPEAFYEGATRGCRAIRTLTAVMEVGGRVGGRRISAKVLFACERPDRVRLEALAPFGKPALILAVHDERVTLVLPRDERYLADAEPRAVLDALFGLDLTALELTALAVGCAVPAGGRVTSASWTDRTHARLEVSDLPNGRAAQLVVRVARDGRRAIESASIAVPGRATDPLLVRYRAGTGAAGVPSDIRLQSRGARVQVSIALDQVDTNIDLEPKTFEVAIPPEAAPLTLEELREAGPLRKR